MSSLPFEAIQLPTINTNNTGEARKFEVGTTLTHLIQEPEIIGDHIISMNV
jgi:hypothetical protein